MPLLTALVRIKSGSVTRTRHQSDSRGPGLSGRLVSIGGGHETKSQFRFHCISDSIRQADETMRSDVG